MLGHPLTCGIFGLLSTMSFLSKANVFFIISPICFQLAFLHLNNHDLSTSRLLYCFTCFLTLFTIFWPSCTRDTWVCFELRDPGHSQLLLEIQNLTVQSTIPWQTFLSDKDACWWQLGPLTYSTSVGQGLWTWPPSTYLRCLLMCQEGSYVCGKPHLILTSKEKEWMTNGWGSWRVWWITIK